MFSRLPKGLEHVSLRRLWMYLTLIFIIVLIGLPFLSGVPVSMATDPETLTAKFNQELTRVAGLTLTFAAAHPFVPAPTRTPTPTPTSTPTPKPLFQRIRDYLFPTDTPTPTSTPTPRPTATNTNSPVPRTSLRCVPAGALQPSDVGKVDFFGGAVAISGDTILIGAQGQNQNAGAAYVYVRSGTTWSQQAKLTASKGAANDLFGKAVALSGDMAIIGAPGDNKKTGAVYVFTRSGSTWSQQTKLTVNKGKTNDALGSAVAISSNPAPQAMDINAIAGDIYARPNRLPPVSVTIGIGTPNAGNGTVFLLQSGPDPTKWTPISTLVDPKPGQGSFGSSLVFLSPDSLAISAYLEDAGRGAVHMAQSTDGGMTWVLKDILTDPKANAGDWFGYSVAGSNADVVIGDPGKNRTGLVAVSQLNANLGLVDGGTITYSLSGAKPGDGVGNAVAVGDGFILFGAAESKSNTGEVWSSFIQFPMTNGEPTNPNLVEVGSAIAAKFGFSLAADNHTGVIGEPGVNMVHVIDCP